MPCPSFCGALVVRVAQVDGHLDRRAVAHVLQGVPDAERGPVRLRGGGEVHDGLREVELRLGQPDVLDGVGGRDGHHERLRVGHADVLARQDDEAAGDEAGVLPRLEHAGEPVERRRRGRSRGCS